MSKSEDRAKKAAWREQVQQHLGALLEQNGFAFTQADTSVWATSVEYASVTTTLKVSRSLEFNEVEAELQRKPVQRCGIARRP